MAVPDNKGLPAPSSLAVKSSRFLWLVALLTWSYDGGLRGAESVSSLRNATPDRELKRESYVLDLHPVFILCRTVVLVHSIRLMGYYFDRVSIIIRRRKEAQGRR